MELGRAQDPRGDRAGKGQALVLELRRLVAAGEPVDADDRDDDDPLHAGPLAVLLQVAGGGREELRRGLLVRRRPRGRVDHSRDARERFGEAVTGDDVDAGRARDRDHLVTFGFEDVGDMASHPAGRSRNRDPLLCLHHWAPFKS